MAFHLRTISQWVLKQLLYVMSFQNNNLKFTARSPRDQRVNAATCQECYKEYQESIKATLEVATANLPKCPTGETLVDYTKTLEL